jgi:hypothetical protein
MLRTESPVSLLARTLIPPRKGRWANWRVRGTHLGTYVDRSTGVRERTIARQIRDRWQREIERGEFERPAPAPEPTFGSAALAYMQFGGESRPHKDASSRTCMCCNGISCSKAYFGGRLAVSAACSF